MNVFKSSNRTDAVDVTNQKWSTRLYIFLLFASLFILILYSLLNTSTRIIEVKNPSLNTVETLQNLTSSLQCPCQVLSVPYEDFLQLEPHYHQVCSSELVTIEWIQGLNFLVDDPSINYHYVDFRYNGPLFQLLKSLCELANETVVKALFDLGKIELVTSQLLERDLFMKEMDSAIEQFEQTLPNRLLNLLNSIRHLTFINQLITGTYGNFIVRYASFEPYTESVGTFEVDGFPSLIFNLASQNCSCANDFKCGANSGLYATNVYLPEYPIYAIPNFYMRCFPIESLLASTLECFYDNESCLSIMSSITNESLFSNFTRLNSSRPSHFLIQAPIADMVAQLFIESWSEALLYSSYFTGCQPASCFYTTVERKNLVEIVTLISSLIGGLSVILRLVCPCIVVVCVHLRHQRWHFGKLNDRNSK